MKNYLLLIPLVALLSSCSTLTSYYQICKVSSDLPTSANGAYEYKNSACDISYDFWTDGGSVSFIVTNNTNEILYVDLSKSFLIKNGIAYDYFLNRTTSSTASIASSQSSGAAGTALGYWNYFGKKIPGSITASSASSVGSQKSSSVAFEEKPVVAIPPHAAKVFSEYTIMSNHFKDCDLYESPSKKEQASMSFNLSNTPVTFTNYICYRVGDSNTDNFIENSFYVSQVSNQHHDATFHKVDVGCPSDEYKTKESVFIRTSPKEFFIKYTPRTQMKSQTGVKKHHPAKDSIYGN